MILECLNDFTKQHIANLVQYSGRSLFRLGNYHGCIESEGMDYRLIMIGQFWVGNCSPAQCTDQQIRVALDFLLDQAKQPYQVSKIYSDIPSYHYPYDFWFFLCFFIIVASLLSVIFASASRRLRHPILSVFSLQNTAKVFQYNRNDLNIFNGVRALAMLWVIFGHQNSLLLGYASNLITIEQNQLFQPGYLLVEAGLFSVDTFFFMGGFFVAYAVLKEPYNSPAKYPLAILNRYLRLVPSYFVAILLFYGVMMHVGSGPGWQLNEQSVKYCESMWRPLLFVDNLVDNGRNMCMGWGWYLQNDMQMFAYCMIILLVYRYSRFFSFVLIYLSMAASFAYTMTVTFENGYKNMTHLSDNDPTGKYYLDLYFKPWSRCPPYLYGLCLGILYYQFLVDTNRLTRQEHVQSPGFLLKLKRQFQSKPWVRRGCEIIGVSIGCFVCFIPRTAQTYSTYWPQYAHSLYLTYGKILFVFSLSMILLPSLLGIDSLVRPLMDNKWFHLMGKVSFWTYLIHYIILTIFLSTRTYDCYFTLKSNYVIFVSHSVSSMVLGFYFMATIEIPFSGLQKMLMNRLFSRQRAEKLTLFGQAKLAKSISHEPRTQCSNSQRALGAKASEHQLHQNIDE